MVYDEILKRFNRLTLDDDSFPVSWCEILKLLAFKVDVIYEYFLTLIKKKKRKKKRIKKNSFFFLYISIGLLLGLKSWLMLTSSVKSF